MTDLPDVTVIMPVRNGERYIADALASILSQEAVTLEVVVVDDGSTDRTRDEVGKVADGRVRVIDGPQQGVAAAMNAGLAAARGRYIARCDSDDLYPSGRLAAQVRFLEASAEFGAVCGRFEVLDAADHRVFLPPGAGDAARELTADLRDGRVEVHLCTYLVRREPMLATGGFRGYFRTGSDVDFQLLLCEQTRVWYEPVTWYAYRYHDASHTHVHASRLRDFNESMARRFQRQRAERESGKDDLQLGNPPAPPDFGEAASDADRASARDQLWEMRWAEAWRVHREGRRAEGMLMGMQAMLRRPWRPMGWRNVAVLCLKSLPLWGGGHPLNGQMPHPDPSPKAGAGTGRDPGNAGLGRSQDQRSGQRSNDQLEGQAAGFRREDAGREGLQ